ncbi:MAG: MMPL family transporter [Verrucomicrobiales bacterium]
MKQSLPRLLLIIIAAVLLAVFGVSRISFNVDILDVLPAELPNVKALSLYREHFNQRRDLVIALRHSDPAALKKQIEALATDLKRDGLASKVEWRSDAFEDPAALSETLAYLWMNSPPEITKPLLEKMTPEQAPTTLAEAIERISGGEFTGAGAMQEQYDPFGFFSHPFLETLMRNAPQGDEFSSPDGTMRLVFLVAPKVHTSYKEDAAWIAELEAYVTKWKAAAPERAAIRHGITGEAPYKSEVAAVMEKDLGGSTILTGIVIALLFWAIQRNFRHLLFLVVCLTLTFATTLAIGGTVFDELSIMSIGFAAILMGLAADYGVLAAQYHASFGGDARSLRRRIGASILWAAATTASVFLVLNLSAFPGIAQLGNLVAIGIAVAALVTLFVFVPLLAAGHTKPDLRVDDGKPAPWWMLHGGKLTVAGAVASLAIFAISGLPKLSYHLSQLPESRLNAMKVFRDIQSSLPAWGEGNFPVLVEGKNDEELRAALGRAESAIRQLQAEGKLEAATVPAALWPQPDYQRAAATSLAAVAARKDSLLAAASEAGFSEEGSALTGAICDAWSRFAGEINKGGTAFPESEAAKALLGRFLARDEDSHVLAGSLLPADYEAMKDRDFEDLAPINQPGVYLAAWQTLQSSIKPLMLRDVRVVVLPTVAILLAMLAVMFRNRRDLLLSLGYLLFCGLVLGAVMVAIDQPWTFQNLAALPVLLGTGIDYAIHVLLALRRYNGDRHRLWIGTGKALVFCGVTTAVGFGTLTQAADPGLASFGRISCIGILIALSTALLVLPAWWALAHRRPSGDAVPEPAKS